MVPRAGLCQKKVPVANAGNGKGRMDYSAWFLVAGLILTTIALAGSLLKRLPLTASMFYLAIGYGLGPSGLGMIDLDPLRDAVFLERLTEVAVLVSLFTAGLKMRVALTEWRWQLPLRLAVLSMVVTVVLVAAAGVFLLGLPLGAAVLLGAILAPTDPVLASDVQVSHAFDRDRLRFGLTGEAGLNDGTAFPFVMLGLGLLGLHELGPACLRWFGVDVLWAVAAGLACGLVLGTALGRLVLYLRRHHRESVGLDDFLTLGLIALAYWAALFVHGYGFLAVFAAGVALRRVEMQATGDRPSEEVRKSVQGGAPEELATHPEKAPAYMAEAMLGFNEQLERIGEVTVVVVLGSMLSAATFRLEALWFVPLLFVVIRPVAVRLGLFGSPTTPLQRRLVGWFGVRGVGSVYYLTFAISHGLPAPLAEQLIRLTFVVVTASIVVHGTSVTPLMNGYARVKRVGERRKKTKGAATLS